MSDEVRTLKRSRYPAPPRDVYEREVQTERVESPEEEVPKFSDASVMTDLSPVIDFRIGDLVQMRSGQIGLIVTMKGDRCEIMIGVRTNQVLVGEIGRKIASDVFVHDCQDQRVCVGDCVRFRPREYSVVAANGGWVYLSGNGKFVGAHGDEITVVGVPKGERGVVSVLGSSVRKVYPKERYSGPFTVVTVSDQGWFRATDGKVEERFSFLDHKKLWLFADEITEWNA
jgi:hypothetical protein